jgi:hypothetical protein
MTGRARLLMAVAAAVLLPAGSMRADGPTDLEKQSAQSSIAYLQHAMDEYHNRFPIYDDISSAGNHFHAWAKIPSAAAPVDINGTWTNKPHSGATSIRAVYTHAPGGTESFGGFYFQNGTLDDEETSPQPNFGVVPNAGIDLTGALSLTFWVKGAVGGEQIEFFVAGVGRNADSGAPIAPYPDSSPRRPSRGTITTLTTSWQRVTIDLAGMDLSYVLGGFGWVADSAHNPSGAVFFLDDIQYNLSSSAKKQRLAQPRFIRSFTTLPLQPDPFDAVQDGDIDFVLRNLAFTYDNALAVLAFLGNGSTDSVRRARLIGDAFVYALAHDRTYNDTHVCGGAAVNPLSHNGARLRTAYSAGDLALPPGWTPKGRVGTVPIPGFYAEATKTFYEVEQQAMDAGNNLWAVIALSALYQRTGAPGYLDAACRIGQFVESFKATSGLYRGFTGGAETPELTPALRPWASTEHNLDANAAYTRLFELTGSARWQGDALHARQFVEAMWDAGRGCYLAGTSNPSTRNTTAGQLPLDVQAWSLLALPAPLPHAGALDCAELNHVTASDGFTGADFNEDQDGVWFEGTGQLAVAEARAGRTGMADDLRVELRRAQQTKPFGDRRGLASSSHDGLSTGFLTAGGDVFKYFRRLHVGATAWNVFAQLNLNPYYSRALTVSVTGKGSVTTPGVSACKTSCTTAWIDGASVTLTAKPASGWMIGSWSGACGGSVAQCTVTMTEAEMAGVTFLQP